jgi:FAD/FMN-containing dehydrogenase
VTSADNTVNSSTGAFSLSIWTRHLSSLEINNFWPVPGSNNTAQVLIAGSGNNWGDALLYALSYDRIVTSGVDRTVGLGGFIQGGGHGPLASTYGLAADQLLQATIVTVSGDVLVCNLAQNQDLFWAVRGGGGGQYGVVTEYVMLTYPTPATIAASSITLTAADTSDYSAATVNDTWAALAQLMASFPDLMDQGVAGSGAAFTGVSAESILGLSGPVPGVLISFNVWALNMTADTMDSLLSAVHQTISASLNNRSLVSVSISNASISNNYTNFFMSMNSSPSSAGQVSLTSSRLLGRAQLSDLPLDQVAAYFQRIMVSQTESDGTMLTIGLQGGPGPRNVPLERRGAVNPVWRDIYLHVLDGGADVNTTVLTPGKALREAAEWLDVNKEAVFREWAPETGAYMNEANPFNSEWKHDFYGTSYDRLVQIKRKFDPTYTLSVWSGVDSEFWEYDMDTGKLCQIL